MPPTDSQEDTHCRTKGMDNNWDPFWPAGSLMRHFLRLSSLSKTPPTSTIEGGSFSKQYCECSETSALSIGKLILGLHEVLLFFVRAFRTPLADVCSKEKLFKNSVKNPVQPLAESLLHFMFFVRFSSVVPELLVPELFKQSSEKQGKLSRNTDMSFEKLQLLLLLWQMLLQHAICWDCFAFSSSFVQTHWLNSPCLNTPECI